MCFLTSAGFMHALLVGVRHQSNNSVLTVSMNVQVSSFRVSNLKLIYYWLLPPKEQLPMTK